MNTTGTPNKKSVYVEEALMPEEHTLLRSIVGKLIWLLPIRSDIAYATKELSRCLVAPTNMDFAKLKHLGRYLVGTLNLMFVLRPTTMLGELPSIIVIYVYVDSDWAGCERTRKSTTGICLMVLGACLHCLSKTQSILALSSGEAELYAIGSGIAEALGLGNFLVEAKLC